MTATVLDDLSPSDPNPAPADPAPAPAPAPADPNLNADPAPNDPPADPAPVVPAADDWRKGYAGDDDKIMKRLGRYSTQNDFIKAGLEAQDQLRTTRSSTLPENPTDEQLAEYREQNGIPKTFGEYDMTLADGLVIGDDDKPMVDGILEAMHGANATNVQVQSMLNAYYQGQEAQIAAGEERDNIDRGAALEELKEEWGPDYHSNKNALSAIINQIPESARDQFINARMPDGTAMLNNPEMLMFLADMSRKTNPAATVVPNSSNPVGAIKDEIKTIEALMAADDPKYWKDEAKQARYRELLTAQEGLG